MKRYFVFLLSGLFLLPVSLFAKDEPDSLTQQQSVLHKYKTLFARPTSTSSSNEQAKAPKRSFFKTMRYSGYARFYPYMRSMKKYYDIQTTNGLTLPFNLTADDGYQQPLMLIRLEGTPSAKTWFQTELQFDNLMKRTLNNNPVTDSTGKLANLYVIFQLQAAIDTRFGKFKLIAGGGANWYRLSPSTLWQYQYRDDMFERYPWEPEGHDFARYNSYYSTNDIPRDQRFGMQATQGFILDMTNLPLGFEGAILYGKNSTSGGFQSYLTSNPQNMIAGRVAKKFGDHKIGFNYFNQFGYNANNVVFKRVAKEVGAADSVYVQDNFTDQSVITGDARLEYKKVSIYTELGAGSYLSNLYNAGVKKNAKDGTDHVSHYKRNWGETLFLEATTQRSLTYLPLKIAVYRIAKEVVNNSNNIVNTSVEQAKPNTGVPDAYYTNYYDGYITDVGQLANNRQGFSLFTNKDFFYNKLKTKLSLGASQEIVNLAGDLRNGGRGRALAGASADSNTIVPYTNSITYEHKLNGFTRSRFAPYERFMGPYGRMHSIFRRAFENIAITDSIINYKKSFSTIDLQLKYKFRLFGKEMIVSNFVDFSSVQDKFSPIPVFTDKAFLRYFYEEFMAFYSIHQKITLVGFVGYETVTGNTRVEEADANGKLITDAKGRPVASPNGKTLHQVGHGYGLGLDYNFHSRASLNIRNRVFSNKDKHFTLDQFKGDEMTVEFKVFF